MAEYGLYGAMVRHSLPLPETIMRQQQQQHLHNQLQQQQSNRSSRNSNSDCENEDALTGSASASATGSTLREGQHDVGAQVISTTETETQEGVESESDCSTAPWLLGMHKKSLEISGRLKSNNSSSSNQQSTERGDSSAITETTTLIAAPNETSTSAAIAAEVSKKRELSSIFMSVKRILACGQPDKSDQVVIDKKKSDSSDTTNQLEGSTTHLPSEQESTRSSKFSAAKVINNSRRHQRSRSNFQQKRRLSKAAAQKLAQMRQQQLEESAVHVAHFEGHIQQQAAARMNESGNNMELMNEQAIQLTPIQKSTFANQGVEHLNGFINRVCQVQAQQQQEAGVQDSSVCGPQNTFFTDIQHPSNKPPFMASNQHGLLLPGQQQQNLLNSLHHLYYQPQPQPLPPPPPLPQAAAAAAFTSAAQQHQQLSAAPINMFGLRPQQEPADLAQIGLFTKNSSATNDSLHQLLSYHASNQVKRLQPRNQHQFQALDSVGHSNEQQAQQLLMAAAAATINGQNQSQNNSNLWLNEWMQRYMLSHSAAMLAAQQQQHHQQQQQQLQPQLQQRQLIPPISQEQQSRALLQEVTTKSRRNNFLNVANLIESNEDEADIDVVRPFVSSSLSLSQQTMLNEDGNSNESVESSSGGGQDLKARKLISANGTPEVARNFHQVN